jgi:hypothetical protein
MKPPHPLRRSSSGGIGTGGSNLDIGSLLEQERKVRFEKFGQELPKSWDVIEGSSTSSPISPAADGGQVGDATLGRQPADRLSSSLVMKDVLRGCKRVVIIGVHGWFPGAFFRTVPCCESDLALVHRRDDADCFRGGSFSQFYLPASCSSSFMRRLDFLLLLPSITFIQYKASFRYFVYCLLLRFFIYQNGSTN